MAVTATPCLTSHAGGAMRRFLHLLVDLGMIYAGLRLARFFLDLPWGRVDLLTFTAVAALVWIEVLAPGVAWFLLEFRPDPQGIRAVHLRPSGILVRLLATERFERRWFGKPNENGCEDGWI